MSDKPTILIKKVPYDMELLTSTISTIMKDEFEKNFKNISSDFSKQLKNKSNIQPRQQPRQPIEQPIAFQINMSRAVQARVKSQQNNNPEETIKEEIKTNNSIPNKYVQTKSRTIPMKTTELIAKKKEVEKPVIVPQNSQPTKFNCGYYAARKKLYALQFKNPTTSE